MRYVRQTAALLLAAGILIAATPGACEPLFTLTDDGRTFLYRARPGDIPSTVAEMFGIPSHDLPAFLAANGITDPTRVGAGFTYRIPNAAARAVADRVTSLEQDNARLRRADVEARGRIDALTRQVDDTRAASADAEARAAALARIDRLWPWAKLAVVVLTLAVAGAVYTAFAAVRRQAQADRWARSLARELEEKRRTALAERQESAKKTIDLESRLRALEAQLGPRVVISGRGGS
jgi:hypothetical protein